MDYYVDVTLLPCQEASDSFLMQVLFERLHKIFTSSQGEIGISFPSFGKTLGNSLRLHGSDISLQRLMDTHWIEGVNDYVKVSFITKIPDVVTYRTVKRVQVKSNLERLMRRSIRKGWLTEEEAAIKIATGTSQTLSLPFIYLRSQSTKQSFRLFIEHGPIVSEPVSGVFNSYGLSSGATIPWF